MDLSSQDCRYTFLSGRLFSDNHIDGHGLQYEDYFFYTRRGVFLFLAYFEPISKISIFGIAL